MKINSTQNPLIKKISKCSKNTKFRIKENLIILDGIHLCEEFLKQKKTFNHLFITPKFKKNSEFKKFEKIKNIIEIPENLMQKITPSNSPIGILGIIRRPPKIEIKKNLEDHFVLLLENIQDPGNLGTIFRTAVASGVQSIFCDSQCTDLFSPKVMRAGMGAHFCVNIFEDFNLKKFPQFFNGNILGTFLESDAKNIFEINLKTPTAFLFGNEGSGISPQLKSICSQKIIIPMANNFESLNVSIASGICLFEKFRQIQKTKKI